MPKNPEKYKGDASNIVYRSSWERKFMRFCDFKESVVAWGSEEFSIPYVSPIDGKVHRYFPDFVAKIKDKAGKEKVFVFEVKPAKQCREPSVPKRKTKLYEQRVTTWGINKAKWEAAQRFCAEHGWEFVLLTEKELNVR